MHVSYTLTHWCVSVIIAGYLCKPEDNIYNIDFVRFKIRDLETSTVLFEIAKPPHAGIVYYVSVCSVMQMKLWMRLVYLALEHLKMWWPDPADSLFLLWAENERHHSEMPTAGYFDQHCLQCKLFQMSLFPVVVDLRGRRGEQRGGRQHRQIRTLPVHPSLPQTEDRGSHVSDSHTTGTHAHLFRVQTIKTIAPLCLSVKRLEFEPVLHTCKNNIITQEQTISPNISGCLPSVLSN